MAEASARIGPAYRIDTDRLVIRCWRPQDAPALARAVTASLDHLRPWMPWVGEEPVALRARVDRLRQFRSKFDADQDYFYGVFDRDDATVLGGAGLHTRAGAG